MSHTKSTAKPSAIEKPLLALGVLLMIVSLCIICWQDAASLPAVVLLMAGTIVTTSVLYVYTGARAREDERIRKAIAFASLNSWLILLWMVTGLIFSIGIYGQTGMSTLRLATLVLLIMLAVFAGWYVYYMIKGDVE